MSNLKDGITEKKYTQQFNTKNKSLYDHTDEYIKPYNITLIWFLENLPETYGKEITVLDLCSGPGKFGYCMRRDKGLKIKYICTDIKNVKIDTPHTLIQHDIRDKIPINDNKIDIALLFSWYHGDLWDIDYSKLMKDIYRVMSPGGLFYLDFPAVNNKIIFTGGGGGTLEERKNISLYLKDAGFEIIRRVILTRKNNDFNHFICKKLRNQT